MPASTRRKVLHRREPGEGPVVVQAPFYMPSRPNVEDLLDALSDSGYTSREIGQLLNVMKWASTSEDRVVFDEEISKLLDDIMAEGAKPESGSLHASLNAHFLPEGKTFLLSVNGCCTLEVVSL